MKLSCEVIQDLLPLYREDMLSQESRSLVKEHIAECDRCRELLTRMEEKKEKMVPPAYAEEALPLKKFKSHIIHLIWISILIQLVGGLFYYSTLVLSRHILADIYMNFYLFLPLLSFWAEYLMRKQKPLVRAGWLLVWCLGFGAGLPMMILKITGEAVWICMLYITVPSIIGAAVGWFKEKKSRGLTDVRRMFIMQGRQKKQKQ